MDSQTRSNYTSILKEDWVELGYQREDDQGLKKKTHPVFQRTNESRPPGAEYIWPQYKSESEYDQMYAEMGVILQMASNMLESPKSLDFLYQVAYSPRKISDGGLSNQGRPCSEFGWAEPPPNPMVRQDARNALRRLSQSLTFQVDDPEANPAVRGSVAVTKWTREYFRNGVKMNDVSSRSGMASKITLNAAYTRKLMELDAQEGDATHQKMSLQVMMAKSLCHEIAHALAFAVDWKLFEMTTAEADASMQAYDEGREYTVGALNTDEPFYRNDRMAEIGNCWENQVFDGKISSSGNTSDPLVVNKWPSFLTSDNIHPRRGKEKRTARKYFVPFHFIRNMHRQSFWDKVKPEHSNALYIKKTIGIEYLNPDAEALSTNSSETGWPRDENSGRVSREKDGQPVPDPSDSGANEPAKYL